MVILHQVFPSPMAIMGGPWPMPFFPRPRCVDTAHSEAQAEEAEEAQLLGLVSLKMAVAQNIKISLG